MTPPGIAGARCRKPMRGLALILATGAALTGALAAGATATGRHTAILAALNAERAANGLPADVRENAAWSKRCAAHVRYMAATGALTHVEDPHSPQYTPSGSWAGRNSVLAAGRSWADGDPFATAPLHLIQLMSPDLSRVGIATDGSRYLCVTTWPGYRTETRSTTAVFTYPGDGTSGVPPAETASELPFVPGEFVGLAPGTATGFNIMVYAVGAAGGGWNLPIVSAQLSGPDGPVEVRTIDRTTPQVGDYLPPGSGFLVPVDPLRAQTTYRATVRFAGVPAHTWTFTTGG